MLSRRTTASRRVRLAVVVVCCLLWAATPSWSAGTGGIVVTPVPAVVDGTPVTSFRVDVPSRGEEEVAFTVSNVEDSERSARVYAARVTRSGDDFVLGSPGSSPYVELEDQEVTLQVDEVVERAFTVRGGEPDDDELAAVVVEVQNGAVRQRASTLIYLQRGQVVPVPLLLTLAAAALATMIGLGALIAARRARRDARPAEEGT